MAKALATAPTSPAASAAGRDRRRPGWRRIAVPAASLLGLALLWQLAATLAADPRLMPGPLAVLAVIGKETAKGVLPYELGVTLLRVAASFVLAMSIGVALGILMGRSRLTDELGGPWLIFFLNLPALVTIVLAYIWIGLVESAAIFAVAINKIPNVVVTIREGSRALDTGLLEMAQVFEIDLGRRLRHIILPQLYPYLMAAARTGLALIWKIVLVVELLGRSSGVGFELGVRFQLFDVAGILAYALAFIAVVQLIEWCVLQPIEQGLNRWRR